MYIFWNLKTCGLEKKKKMTKNVIIYFCSHCRASISYAIIAIKNRGHG